jgi:hypothetical protein
LVAGQPLPLWFLPPPPIAPSSRYRRLHWFSGFSKIEQSHAHGRFWSSFRRIRNNLELAEGKRGDLNPRRLSGSENSGIWARFQAGPAKKADVRRTGCAARIEQCVSGRRKRSAIRDEVSEVQAEKLALDLNDLRTLDDDELDERWRHLYGKQPPRRVHRSLSMPPVRARA